MELLPEYIAYEDYDKFQEDVREFLDQSYEFDGKNNEYKFKASNFKEAFKFIFTKQDVLSLVHVFKLYNKERWSDDIFQKPRRKKRIRL